MANSNSGCHNDCAGRAVIASIIIGIITAVLRIIGVITLTPAFLWVLFGIAVVFLGIALFASGTGHLKGARLCLCKILPVFLTGILGTVLTSVILLGITFAATSIIGAIIAGALLLFFSLFIISAACLVKCLAGCSESTTTD